ncbi:MAG TPA: glycosyltransferase [Thermoanaerobaculia bacterium]
MRRLDLLFLTQTYPRFAGDTSGPFIQELARGLTRAGDRVTVLAPHMAGLAERWEEEGVEVVTFRYAPERFEAIGYSRSLQADERMKAGAALAAPLYLRGARRAVRRQLASHRYDLLHAHWIVPNALAGAPAATQLPFAIGLHGSDVFLAEKALLRSAARRALGRASLLTGCSPELVDRVCALGFPAERSRVIPYGVDPAAFSPDPARSLLWRDRLAIPAAAPVLLGVGRMATKKGFQVLLEVLPALLAARADLHVILAGGGDRWAEFAAIAGRFGEGPERVHMPGAVLRDTLPDLYRAADLFVLPAVHDASGNVDGLPNVILEAMASGLPVVATDVSGIPLAVGDGATGLLVEEGERAPLAAAILSLLDAPERARRMGSAGRRKVLAELTWDAVAAQYHMAYEGALA